MPQRYPFLFAELERMAETDDLEMLARLLVSIRRQPAARFQELRLRILERVRLLSANEQALSSEWKWKRRVAALERELELSRRGYELIERRLASLIYERDCLEKLLAQRAAKPETEQLYGRVGLTPKCPNFVVEAVRREYLRRLHPDSLGRAPDELKKAAEERFKQAFEVFDKIAALRASIL